MNKFLDCTMSQDLTNRPGFNIILYKQEDSTYYEYSDQDLIKRLKDTSQILSKFGYVVRLWCDSIKYQQIAKILSQNAVNGVEIINTVCPKYMKKQENDQFIFINQFPTCFYLISLCLSNNQIIGRFIDNARTYGQCCTYFMNSLHFAKQHKIKYECMMLLRLDYYFWFTIQQQNLTIPDSQVSTLKGVIRFPYIMFPGVMHLVNKLNINQVQNYVQKNPYTSKFNYYAGQITNKEYNYFIFTHYINEQFLPSIVNSKQIGICCLYDIACLLLDMSRTITNVQLITKFDKYQQQYITMIKSLYTFDYYERYIDHLSECMSKENQIKYLDPMMFNNNIQVHKFVTYISQICSIQSNYNQVQDQYNQQILFRFALQMLSDIKLALNKEQVHLNQYLEKKINSQYTKQILLYVFNKGKLIKVHRVYTQTIENEDQLETMKIRILKFKEQKQ